VTIVENKNIQEFKDVTFDKLRVHGAFTSWQRKLYIFITVRLAVTILEKLFIKINEAVEDFVPEGTDKEEIKDTIKLSLLNYVDSVF